LPLSIFSNIEVNINHRINNKELFKKVNSLQLKNSSKTFSKNRCIESLIQENALINSLPWAIFEIDRHSIFTFANKRTLEMLRNTENDLKHGVNFLQTLVHHDALEVSKYVNRIFQGTDLGIHECTALRKEGSTFPIALHGIPVFTNDKTTVIRGFAVDISELKKLEKELQISQKEFYSLFHNNPESLVLS